MTEVDLGPFLRVEDVKEKDTLTVTKEGYYEKIPKGPGKDPEDTYHLPVKLSDGKEKIWTPNRTSVRTIASVLGTDDKAWVGKVFKIFKVKQNVSGDMKEVIYAESPAKA